MTLSTFYPIFDLAVLLFLAVQIWSLIRLLRRRHSVVLRPRCFRQGLAQARKTAIPLLWELGLGVGLVFAVPALTGSTWWHDFMWTPDLASAIAVVTALWIVTGLTRVFKVVRALLTSEPSVAAHPPLPKTA